MPRERGFTSLRQRYLPKKSDIAIGNLLQLQVFVPAPLPVFPIKCAAFAKGKGWQLKCTLQVRIDTDQLREPVESDGKWD